MFAAAAAEVLPDLLHAHGERAALEVVLGFAAGAALMLGLRRFSDWLERRRKRGQRGKPEAEQARPTSLLAANERVQALLPTLPLASPADRVAVER